MTDRLDVEGAKVGELLVRLAKKHSIGRMAIVAAFVYALRASLNELSPDERDKMLAWATNLLSTEGTGT